MSPRRSLGLPITLATIMIVLLVALIVGWVLLSIFGVASTPDWAAFYWTLLPLGILFLAMVLAGVITYLVLSIKAIQLNRRQSNFIDSVTHELKSPIASLKLYLQTLNRRDVPREQRMGFYRDMLEDVERLDQLINHVLSAARLDTLPDEVELEEIEAAQVVQDAAATVCQTHRISGDVVSLDLQPCVVKAKRVDLEMIFRNLIDNAVKYGAAQPKVDVTLRLDDHGRAVARIADNGPGIPHKLRQKVFGRFVRLGVELERKTKGTGLGLFIVGTLVRRLKGRVVVKDREDGPGAVLEVSLPARPVAKPSEEAVGAAPLLTHAE